ncbi:MAG TPA: c-type cytochrome [Terracidiphilus sp.]
MKPSSLALPASATALLAAALFALSMVAQAPQTPQSPAGSPSLPPPRTFPAPTNLKVLPKNLTGQQVRDIMEQWQGSLGVHCSTCHTPDPNDIGPNGRPRLNYADDSRPEKATARLMYTMVEDINRNYVSKIESSEMPVTCGTCHRGHLGPEPFIIPPDDHDRPRPPQSPSQTPPLAGTTPSLPH